jgi:hypothetical protein
LRLTGVKNFGLRDRRPESGYAKQDDRRLKGRYCGGVPQTGGVDYLVWLSKEHPSVYATLLGRVLPTEFDGSLTAQVDVTIPPEERRAIAQELFDRAFSLMGKSRPHPQIIEVEAIQAPK